MQYTSVCPKEWNLDLINFYLKQSTIKNYKYTNKKPIFKINYTISIKISKFLEINKIVNFTFKQNQIIKTEQNSETQKCSYFKYI